MQSIIPPFLLCYPLLPSTHLSVWPGDYSSTRSICLPVGFRFCRFQHIPSRNSSSRGWTRWSAPPQQVSTLKSSDRNRKMVVKLINSLVVIPLLVCSEVTRRQSLDGGHPRPPIQDTLQSGRRLIEELIPQRIDIARMPQRLRTCALHLAVESQQNLDSSTCVTSKPTSQEPTLTSSLAYRCRIGELRPI